MSESRHDPIRPATEREEPEIHLSDYFWRPRWVKLWWASAALVWIGVVLHSWRLIEMPFDPEGGWQFWVTMAFHPFFIVPVLGYRLAWAWRRDKALFPWDSGYSGMTEEDDPIECLYGGPRIGFHRPTHLSYMSDPMDVRSPLNPANPSNLQ